MNRTLLQVITRFIWGQTQKSDVIDSSIFHTRKHEKKETRNYSLNSEH